MAEQLTDRDEAFPRLGEELLAVLDVAGQRRSLANGKVLYRAGDPSSEFFVVLHGRVALVDGFGSGAERVLRVVDEGRSWTRRGRRSRSLGRSSRR
jgi:thioredoxin reductase (NADPH)